jgi:hypothetical protein
MVGNQGSDMQPKDNKMGKWLLFWLAPTIPIRHAIYNFYMWMCGRAYRVQVGFLKKALKLIGSQEELNNVNAPNFLFLAISETGKGDLKLSGFYAETEDAYKKEFLKVPGNKLIVISLASLRNNVIDNFMERKFYDFRAELIARNGGHYIH